MKQSDKELALFLGIAAGVGIVLFLANRSSASAQQPIIIPPKVPLSPTPSRTQPQTMTIVPLQNPDVPLVNTNDPANDRLVTQVMAAQLTALHAPRASSTLIRATAYLTSVGSDVPNLPPGDMLYWAADKVNRIAQQTFYS